MGSTIFFWPFYPKMNSFVWVCGEKHLKLAEMFQQHQGQFCQWRDESCGKVKRIIKKEVDFFLQLQPAEVDLMCILSSLIEIWSLI